MSFLFGECLQMRRLHLLQMFRTTCGNGQSVKGKTNANNSVEVIESLTGTAIICCSQTEILLPRELKSAFSAFRKFTLKFIEFFPFKAKTYSPATNHQIMNYFEQF